MNFAMVRIHKDVGEKPTPNYMLSCVIVSSQSINQSINQTTFKTLQNALESIFLTLPILCPYSDKKSLRIDFMVFKSKFSFSCFYLNTGFSTGTCSAIANNYSYILALLQKTYQKSILHVVQSKIIWDNVDKCNTICYDSLHVGNFTTPPPSHAHAPMHVYGHPNSSVVLFVYRHPNSSVVIFSYTWNDSSVAFFKIKNLKLFIDNNFCFLDEYSEVL